MARFADVLRDHPAPRQLGDVTLRFEPSMLIGETPKGERTWRPTAAWIAGISALLFALGLFLLRTPLEPIVGLVTAGAVAFAAAVWLERVDRRRRCFVANFATNSLRLDFVTPFVGKPTTLVVSFDAVRAVSLMKQGDGAQVLTVDFVEPGGKNVLREVLAAFIPAAQEDDALRVARLLEGAFGLGTPPADSPYFAEQRDESSFQD